MRVYNIAGFNGPEKILEREVHVVSFVFLTFCAINIVYSKSQLSSNIIEKFFKCVFYKVNKFYTNLFKYMTLYFSPIKLFLKYQSLFTIKCIYKVNRFFKHNIKFMQHKN